MIRHDRSARQPGDTPARERLRLAPRRDRKPPPSPPAPFYPNGVPRWWDKWMIVGFVVFALGSWIGIPVWVALR